MVLPMKCYPNHIPTTTWEKIFLTFGAGITAMLNPYRDDMVALVSETTSTHRLSQLRFTMLSHPVGRRILRTRPLITSLTVPLERDLYPPGSFGEAYVTYMQGHAFDSDARCPVQLVDDPELAYILTRYRQVHDFLHALTGLPATVHGELGLKWWEFWNLKLPMPLLASVFGGLNHETGWYSPFRNHSLYRWGWSGHQAECMLNIDFEHRLKDPLDTLRKEFNIQPAPRVFLN
ncbi:Ubiquinone biosynthesis protein [Coelomomyces lativittatus]|nr:Ubiquinone biosynthesis protein [Coelomomyces lativittatus]KAJ1512483.1 Ubiquinone biosynthesis protein [Coelomomyces lativittatus]KAJ1516301.1 Ubiquinone biosynthesis protein [Coelomomyces lativittatus]